MLAALVAMFVVIAVSYLAGFIFDCWPRRLDLHPIDLIKLMFDGAFCVFAAWYIARRVSASRIEKDILISDIREIESITRDLIDSDKVDGDECLLSLINKLHCRIEILNSVAPDYNHSEVREKFYDLYEITTDHFAGDRPDSLEIQQKSAELICALRREITQING